MKSTKILRVGEEKGKRHPTIEYVRSKFQQRGYHLLSERYVNRESLLEYVCPIHGKMSIKWGNFIRGSRCSHCTNCAHDYAYIQRQFEEAGYTLQTSTYINSTQELTYHCPKHGEQTTIWRNFRRTRTCPDCKKERGSKFKVRTLSEKDMGIIGKRFEKLVVLNVHSMERRKRTLFLCECDCGNETTANRSQLERGLKKSCGCLLRDRSVKVVLNHEEKTLNEWASILDMNPKTLGTRISKGYSEQDIFTNRKRFKGSRPQALREIIENFEGILRFSFSSVERKRYASYDFMINRKKVLVKIANMNESKYGQFVFSYNIRNRDLYPDEISLPKNRAKLMLEKACDYLLLVMVEGEQFHTWIIPSDQFPPLLQAVKISPYVESKYNEYLEKWEYLST